MKKLLALLTAAVLAFTALSGCGGSSGANGTENAGEEQSESTAGQAAEQEQETVKFKFVLPGNAPRDIDIVAEEINKKLAEDKVGLELERTYIPWDAWEQKINLMITSGDEFDMFHVMNDWIPLSNYVAKNGLADLTQAIDKYGENIKKVVPEAIFSGASIEGRLYAIPTYWYELATFGAVDIRLDVLRKNNLEMPETPDELLEAAEVVINNWNGPNKPYFANALAGMDPNEMPIHRTFDSWPFSVKDGLFYIDGDGEIKSWYETPEFKLDAEFMRRAYKIGLIHPDILTLKAEQQAAISDNGDWFIASGTGAASLAAVRKNNPEATLEDVIPFFFSPEKPYMRPMTVKNSNAVPVTSRNPESAVKFLNWLWSSQENYDLYFYGIEDMHYKKVGERGKEWILDPNNNNNPTYNDSDWMSGNIEFIRADDVNYFPANNTLLYTPMEDAVNNPAANFQFDASVVKAEYSNVKTQAAALMAPIFMGVVDYDRAYGDAIEKLKKAGLDKVVEEYKRQYAEWKAAGGK